MEGPIEVLLNEYDIGNSYNNSLPRRRSHRSKISEIIIHPRYENHTYDFDIAILRLAEKIDLSPVEPVKQINEDNDMDTNCSSSTTRTTTRTTVGPSAHNHNRTVKVQII
jgi:hypothetical protein